MNYRKKNYRGRKGYSGRPHRRTADSYHQPLPPDTNRIPYGRHTLTKPDVEAVVDALLSGTLTQGRELERFESLLAKLTHSEFAIAFSSGTAAIHSALACLKLEPEDEVIVPTLTFCSVANMVRLVGARVVLADCDPDTHTLSVEAARAAVTENTKAIFTNNFGGHPSDLQALREICDEHNLLLLEDASHGLGGKHRGHYVGNQADLTCFSFHPSKAITTCEGGAVTTNNRAIADWMRQFRHHGIQKDARYFKSEEKLPDFYQELQFSGMNYRMSEIHAALGRSQLTRLDRHIDRRRSIAQVYHQKLGSVEQIRLPYVADWADSAYHIFPIEFTAELSDSRDEIYAGLKEAGIDVQVHYVPLHRMPLFSGEWKADQFPNAEAYFSRCLTLPLYCDYSFKDLERVTDLLMKIIRGILGEDASLESNTDAPTQESDEKEEAPQEASAPEPEAPAEEPVIPEAPQEEPAVMPPPISMDGGEGLVADAPPPAEREAPAPRGRRPRKVILKKEAEPKDEGVEESPAIATPEPSAEEPVTPKDSEAAAEAPEAEEAEKPKKTTRRRTTRTRTKKADTTAGEDAEANAEKPVKKPRATRTRKTTTTKAKPRTKAAKDGDEGDGEKPKTTRRRTTRAKKVEPEAAPAPESAPEE